MRVSVGGCVLNRLIKPAPENGLMMKRCAVAGFASRGMACAATSIFLRALARNKKAQSFFEGLSRANVYAIAYRLQTAKKPETREKRMRTILAMLARGESFH